MNGEQALRLIGLSHLLQPPLTLILASRRGLDLRTAIGAQTALAAGVLHNMAIAAVLLPTTFGLVLALHADEALAGGAARTLGFGLAAFWCWRLWRQVWVLRPLWPHHPRYVSYLNIALTSIFVLQGPLLLALLAIRH
ncbi:MAG: hypothetical protein QM756_33875 [Polyangiaceae bacterium]